MTTSTNDELLQQAQQCFFAAMMQGWAAEVKAVPVPDMPGHKQTIYENGKFRVIDRFCVSSAGMSAGATTIWYTKDPIWFMSYGGIYSKEDIPFLKRALVYNYSRGFFLGGRGPTMYLDEMSEGKFQQDNLLIYDNREQFGSFRSFRGHERICLAENPSTVRGWHDYWGVALI